MKQITENEVRLFANIATSLEADYKSQATDWDASPFGWIRQISSIKQRGTIGEKLVAGWLAARGFNVQRSKNTDADRIVEDKRIEIKFAMLGKSGSFVFNQFRDQAYDAVLCIGVCPFDAKCWLIPKSLVLDKWDVPGGIRLQHDPKNPNANTGILTVSRNKPRPWLVQHGGSLRAGLDQISVLTGFVPEM